MTTVRGRGVLETGDPRINHPKSSLRSLLRTPEPEDDGSYEKTGFRLNHPSKPLVASPGTTDAGITTSQATEWHLPPTHQTKDNQT